MRGTFETGQVVFTPGAYDRAGSKIAGLLRRHRKGDWGDLSTFDAAQNKAALENGERIFSSYHIPEGTIWIITEATDDEGVRNSTCILTPEDY